MALKVIDQLGSKLAQLKDEFEFCQSIDFLADNGEHITIDLDAPDISRHLLSPETMWQHLDLPDLAYTSNSKPIRTHIHELEKLLLSIDGVQTGGENEARDRRKELVNNVEEEIHWTELWWKRRVWSAYQRAKRTSGTFCNMRTVQIHPCLGSHLPLPVIYFNLTLPGTTQFIRIDNNAISSDQIPVKIMTDRATCPPLDTLTIICDRLPPEWKIVVVRPGVTDGTRRVLRVADILGAIYESLCTCATPAELKTLLPPQKKFHVYAAREARCNHSQNPADEIKQRPGFLDLARVMKYCATVTTEPSEIFGRGPWGGETRYYTCTYLTYCKS